MNDIMKNDMSFHGDRLFADPTLPLAVVVTRTSWDEPPRIRHQVARQLLRFFNVLYVQKDYANKEDKIIKISDRHIIFIPGINKLFSMRLYANFPAYHHIVNEQFARKIDFFLSLFETNKKILVNFEYDFYQIMKRTYYDQKIHICYDEFPKMRRTQARMNILKERFQAWLYQRYENAVAKHAHRCLASHELLKRKLEIINSNTELFLHGHEFNGFHSTKLVSKTKPIKVGFMGYIMYNLLVEWLFKIVKNEDMYLYLIGPIEKFDITNFSAYKNFAHIPPLTGKKLFETLSDMDILIMPYDTKIPQCRIQTASNKFFQYLSAGKPVVISDMKYYIKMPEGVIYRAKNPDEFIAKIRQAFNEDCDDYVNLRKRIAKENTWDKRGDQLFRMICEAIPTIR